MREIRYRAYNKRTSKMCNVLSIFFNHKVARLQRVDGGVKSFLEQFDDIILMQYTGIDDKNGLGIFEKDIVKAKTADGFERIYLVDWYEREREYALFLKGEAWIRLSVNYEIEVIGNVYQNKVLLEG